MCRKILKDIFSSKYFALILCLACMLFIFSRSMRDADISSNESGGIVKFVISFFHNVFGVTLSEEGIVVKIVRKLAHFSEFFILGALSFYVKMTISKDIFKGAGYSLLYGVMTALCDETIQYFYKGRSAEVRDVWIDFAGFLFAYLLLSLIFYAVYKKKSRAKRTGFQS